MLTSVQTTTPNTIEQPRVCGIGLYDSAQTAAGEHPPALILNPAAKRADVLAWCASQACDLNTLVDFISMAESGVVYEPSEVAAMFQGYTRPLHEVLKYLVETGLQEETNHAR